MKPDWLKLLERRKQEGFGLTLPFLYGAVYRSDIPQADSARDAFQLLILSMRDDAPEGYQVRIHECDSLWQPIAGLVYSPQPWCVGWPSPYKPTTALEITSEYLGDGEPVESALGVLWSRCRVPILANTFSYRRGVYQPFDAKDHTFIEEAVAESAGDDY